VQHPILAYKGQTCGLYYKHITIINDDSRVVIIIPQLGASVTIVILMTPKVSFMLLESSIMLLENIYSTGITNDDCHIFIVQATGWKCLTVSSTPAS
jgi:hypothetical protein